MSRAPAPISDGVYRIFNVAFQSNTADLTFPAGSTGTVGGHPNNFSSLRMVWKLTNVSGNLFVLINQEVQTFAQTNGANNTLVGNPESARAWAASSSGTEGEYYISSLDGRLAWTLANGNTDTPITLSAIANPKDTKQVWKFQRFQE